MSIQDEIKRIDQQIKEHQQLLKDPDLSSLAQEEIKKLIQQKNALQSSLSLNNHSQKTKQNSYDQFNAILEIRSAAGGDEAKIWAQDLKRMYLRFANIKGFKVEELDDTTLKIIGKGAFSTFKQESGVHRVQRVPETEKQGRIHTSTASVAVLPEISESQINIRQDDLEWQFTRAGGPGGQYVNKAATAVRLTHKPTGMVISVRQERIQQQNKAIALDLLRAKLWEQQESKRQEEITKSRRSAVGRGMRSEKIRTYNFPQNRVTDHRINKSWYELESIVDGNLDKILEALKRKN